MTDGWDWFDWLIAAVVVVIVIGALWLGYDTISYCKDASTCNYH